MEKKNEMGFIEKFEAAGKELEKVMAVSNKEAMIMIATSEGNDERRVYLMEENLRQAILFRMLRIG